MSENDLEAVKAEGRSSSLMTKIGIGAAVVLVAFLLGFVPMWLKARQSATDLEATQKLLKASEIRGLLTSATVDAGQGDYEPARQEMSEFFTNLQAEIDKGDDGALTAGQREKLKPIFDNRDSTITMLAQRDQASTQRLPEIYKAYRQAIAAIAAPQPTR